MRFATLSLTASLLLGIVSLRSPNAAGQTTANQSALPAFINSHFRPKIHDPSTILKQDGLYYCFSTGVGVQSLISDDLIHWRIGPPLFAKPPAWAGTVAPNHSRQFWAPDVVKRGDRYLVYYSVSAFGKNTSAIALASSPTLDPQSPDYQWTDEGIVVQTDATSDHNAIDPGLFADPNGKLWLTYGSFWTGIKLVELDPHTGKRIAADSPLYSLAHNAEIEAPALLFHDDKYYLFVNWGFCCRGVKSTYNIRVGRSDSVTGPYLDRAGVNMLKGGGTLVLDTKDPAIGPGHAAFLKKDGALYMSYHYYNADNQGLAQMAINRVTWDQAGWPQVNPTPAYTATLVDAKE
jgi:arabinan endo-1,5-alpha-L-arabinosidase